MLTFTSSPEQPVTITMMGNVVTVTGARTINIIDETVTVGGDEVFFDGEIATFQGAVITLGGLT